MGRINKYTCPSCNISWQVRLGHGMGHAVLESVLDEFPADIRQKILTDTEGEQIPVFEFNYRPAACRRCKKLVSVPTIYLRQRGYTYSAACSECGSDVSIIDEGTEIACPYCEKGVLLVQETGNWD